MIVANLTMIVANLALARSINNDHKACCKLKHNFMIVNYDPKTFDITGHRAQCYKNFISVIYEFL
jgi:hypothetical protein